MGKIYKNGIEYGGGGGDSAGHIILDNDGTAMAEEPNLRFKGLNVTDNSTDEVTEVESVGLNQDSMDDVLNASVSGNQVASDGLVYSTEEQVVGKWIDGKPIYQITIQDTMPTCVTNGTVVDKYIPISSSIGTLIAVEQTVILLDESVAYIIPRYLNAVGVGVNAIRVHTNAHSSLPNQVIISNNYTSWNGCNTYITIQYTKTTD